MRRQLRIIGLLAAAPTCGALVLGTAPATAQFRLEPSLSVQESFSDNVDQAPDGQETQAFITDVSPGATLRWTGRRVTTSLDLSLTASHQTEGDDKGVSVEPDAAGLGSVEVLQEHLFLDASAAASSELLNTREQDTQSNRTIIQNYSASPRLVGRFGSFADAEASYRFDQVISEDSGDSGDSGGTASLDNSQTHTIGAALNSGPDFARLRWGLSGKVSESSRGSDDNVSRRDATLDLEYAVDRSFSLLGSAGYQSFDDGEPENDIDAPTWRAGLRWRPGPRTDLSATYGQSDDQKSLAANLRYQITPQTGLFAIYREVLETGQERLVEDLSSIGTDPDTGALIDTRTGLPFDPSTSSTTVDNGTQRTKSLSTGLTGVRGRNTFGVTGRVELSTEEGGLGDDEDGYDVNLFWGRQLSPRARINAAAGYSRNEFQLEGRVDNEYTASIGYSYSIFTNVRAFGGYIFTKNDSADRFESFVENVVTLGVGASF